MENHIYKKLVVIGTTDSGKSTLAEQLANKLGLHFIELDVLHWEPNWVEAPLEVFRSRVESATQAQAWAVAGNYRIVRDLVWSKAEAVIWLDYSFWVIFWLLWWSTWKRVFLKVELWNGNREHLRTQLRLWSDESLFHWLFQTYWRRKREYSQLFEMPEHQNLCVFHFQFPSQVKNWLESL
jgi:adenylate kinase family enzyme